MTKSRVIKILASKIEGYCDTNNVSLYEFSLRCGLTYSTLSNIVLRKIKDIRLTTVLKICLGMDIQVNEFFDDFEFKELLENYYLWKFNVSIVKKQILWYDYVDHSNMIDSPKPLGLFLVIF